MNRLDLMRVQQQLLKQNGDARFLSHQFHGVKMRFDLSNFTDLLILFEILRDGYYERPTSLFVIDFLRPDGVFVDVGANCGYYSLLASKLVGPEGKVYSFEPSSYAMERLRANLEANHVRNIVLSTMALGKVTTRRRFYTSTDNDGTNSFIAVDRRRVETVEVSTLDSIIDEPHVDLVKIDVEGAECDVLRGMTRLLKQGRISMLIVEWNKRIPQNSRGWDSHFDYMKRVGNVSLLLEGKGKTYELKPVANRFELPLWCNLLIQPFCGDAKVRI